MRSLGLFLSCLVLVSCTQQQKIQEYYGEAQGTTYHIKVVSSSPADHSPAIDSILFHMDQSMSLYIDSSVINKVNSTDTILSTDPYFHQVFNASKEIYHHTNGAFDPAVFPLVRGWGFGKDKTPTLDSTRVDSLLPLVNFQGMHMDSNHILTKNHPHIQLDFNGIAQGYTVDVIGDYLAHAGIENYMIELGGEVLAKGKKPNDIPWKIGIDQPLEDGEERQLQAIVPLENKAMATSGNYRQFYVKNGVKYAHCIDPKTGYPVTHTLLSATVLTERCANADGYATAFMVMGVEKTKRFLREHANLELEVLLIHTNTKGEWETFASEGMKALLQETD